MRKVATLMVVLLLAVTASADRRGSRSPSPSNTSTTSPPRGGRHAATTTPTSVAPRNSGRRTSTATPASTASPRHSGGSSTRASSPSAQPTRSRQTATPATTQPRRYNSTATTTVTPRVRQAPSASTTPRGSNTSRWGNYSPPQRQQVGDQRSYTPPTQRQQVVQPRQRSNNGGRDNSVVGVRSAPRYQYQAPSYNPPRHDFNYSRPRVRVVVIQDPWWYVPQPVYYPPSSPVYVQPAFPTQPAQWQSWEPVAQAPIVEPQTTYADPALVDEAQPVYYEEDQSALEPAEIAPESMYESQSVVPQDPSGDYQPAEDQPQVQPSEDGPGEVQPAPPEQDQPAPEAPPETDPPPFDDPPPG